MKLISILHYLVESQTSNLRTRVENLNKKKQSIELELWEFDVISANTWLFYSRGAFAIGFFVYSPLG